MSVQLVWVLLSWEYYPYRTGKYLKSFTIYNMIGSHCTLGDLQTLKHRLQIIIPLYSLIRSFNLIMLITALVML